MDSTHQSLAEMVREILLLQWDPVGFRSFPDEWQMNNRDEYDSYIPDIIKMIKARAQESEFESYLRHIEKTKMRETPDSRAREAARSIFDLQSTY